MTERKLMKLATLLIQDLNVTHGRIVRQESRANWSNM
jgi:hypothetical protein